MAILDKSKYLRLGSDYEGETIIMFKNIDNSDVNEEWFCQLCDYIYKFYSQLINVKECNLIEFCVADWFFNLAGLKKYQS